MGERSRDWLNQAERNIKQAEASLRDGYYEWACFASQQASEKAVIAIIQALGGEVIGHSIMRFIISLPDTVKPQHLVDKAIELDLIYLSGRFPTSWPAGFPGSNISKVMAERLVEYGKEIVSYCQEAVMRAARERPP